jgi:hypothetical protein
VTGNARLREEIGRASVDFAIAEGPINARDPGGLTTMTTNKRIDEGFDYQR